MTQEEIQHLIDIGKIRILGCEFFFTDDPSYEEALIEQRKVLMEDEMERRRFRW